MDDATLRRPIGVLYRLDPDLSLHAVEDGLTVPNGLAWSADGATLFHSDSNMTGNGLVAAGCGTGNDARFGSVCGSPRARTRRRWPTGRCRAPSAPSLRWNSSDYLL